MRLAWLIAMLPAGVHAAKPPDNVVIAVQLRWDIAAVLPDAREQTQDNALEITHLRTYRMDNEAERDLLLVCATVAFDEPEVDPTGVALIYSLGRRGGLQAMGPPFFHGLNWARGQVPPADACEAAASGLNAVLQRGDP